MRQRSGLPVVAFKNPLVGTT
jgi:hypothetical protein